MKTSRRTKLLSAVAIAVALASPSSFAQFGNFGGFFASLFSLSTPIVPSTDPQPVTVTLSSLNDFFATTGFPDPASPN